MAGCAIGADKAARSSFVHECEEEKEWQYTGLSRRCASCNEKAIG